MATFPLLSSGAITQYPAPQVTGQGVDVIRFMDGTDQRYLTQGRQLRRWQIRLDLLNGTETQQIESFFTAQQGDYSTFAFPDPFSGTAVPKCRIGTAELVTQYVAVDAASTSFWVIETNG
jgi:hypothetical protein